MVAMVLAGSVAWWDDYSSLLIPLLVVVGLAARGRAGRPVMVTAGALFLAAGVAYPALLGLGGSGWLPSTYGSAWWWPALQLELPARPSPPPSCWGPCWWPSAVAAGTLSPPVERRPRRRERAGRHHAAPPAAAAALRLLPLLAAAAVIFALVSFVVDPLTGHFGGSFEDFSAYLGAARSMAAGGSPYAQFDPSTVVMSGFIYPPFAALVVRPLALLSDQAAMDVWLFVNLGCAAAGAVVLARTALPRTWPATELGLLAVVIFAPATYNYWHGQINPLIFLLLAVAFWAYVRDRQVTAGLLLGLAAAIKIAPVIFLVLLLRRRWWRAAGCDGRHRAGHQLDLLAVSPGLGAGVTFLTRVLPDLNRATGWIYNQSLGGAVSRLADQSVLRVQPTSAARPGRRASRRRCWSWGLAGWATRPGSRSPEERGVEFGLGITAMLLAGGIAWYPHFMHLLIPLFAVARPGGRARMAGGALGGPGGGGGPGGVRGGRAGGHRRPDHERDHRDQPDRGVVALPTALLAAVPLRGLAGRRRWPGDCGGSRSRPASPDAWSRRPPGPPR